MDEKWLQERLAEDPNLLGLGELELKDVERRQPRAGRLDLLLTDPETRAQYEVEVQLGATDEAPLRAADVRDDGPLGDDPSFAASSPTMRDFAEIWQAAEKVVYSRTLDVACTSRTRIEREFDPSAVRRLKESSAGDLLIGGAELAAGGFAAGLIDECHIFLAPVLVGAGKCCWPDRVRVVLELLEEPHFGNGMVLLRYRTTV